MAEFSHYDNEGRATMVDIGDKEKTSRFARASGRVRMKNETLRLIKEKLLPKGDLFEVARVAGIMAAKKTPDLIPLCHTLALTFADVAVSLDETLPGIVIFAEIRLDDRTGAEMEALAAVSVAALTVYDMCKAVDSTMIIDGIKLEDKKGGKSDRNSIK